MEQTAQEKNPAGKIVRWPFPVQEKPVMEEQHQQQVEDFLQTLEDAAATHLNIPPALEDQSRQLVEASYLVITNADEFQQAGDLANDNKDQKKKIKDFFKRIKEIANKVHKGICTIEDKYLFPHDQAIEFLETGMKDHRAAVKAEQDRLQREADDRRRADEKAAADKAEADRKAQLEKDEEERLAKAAALEEAGDKAAAEKVLDAPPPPPPPPPPPAPRPVPVASFIPTPKASGVGFRDNWKAKDVTSDGLVLLIQAAAKEPERYARFLEANQQMLNQEAKAMKQNAKIPGVEFENVEVSFSSRRGK